MNTNKLQALCDIIQKDQMDYLELHNMNTNGVNDVFTAGINTARSILSLNGIGGITPQLRKDKTLC